MVLVQPFGISRLMLYSMVSLNGCAIVVVISSVVWLHMYFGACVMLTFANRKVNGFSLVFVPLKLPTMSTVIV